MTFHLVIECLHGNVTEDVSEAWGTLSIGVFGLGSSSIESFIYCPSFSLDLCFVM